MTGPSAITNSSPIASTAPTHTRTACTMSSSSGELAGHSFSPGGGTADRSNSHAPPADRSPRGTRRLADRPTPARRLTEARGTGLQYLRPHDTVAGATSLAGHTAGRRAAARRHHDLRTVPGARA